MTQEEKLIARLESLESGLYNVCVAVVDGKIIFWVAPVTLGRLEGFPKPVKIEEGKAVENVEQTA